MRILKKGKLQADRRGTCRKCNTVIAFSKKEAKLVHDFRDGDYWIVPCPTCKAEITVAAGR